MVATSSAPMLTAKLDACNKVLVIYADGKRAEALTKHRAEAARDAQPENSPLRNLIDLYLPKMEEAVFTQGRAA